MICDLLHATSKKENPLSTNPEPLRCRLCYAVFAVHVCTPPKGAAGTPIPSRCPHCGSADVTAAEVSEEQAQLNRRKQVSEAARQGYHGGAV